MIESFITVFIIYFVAIHPLAISLLVGPSAIILAGLSVQYIIDGLAAIGLVTLP